MTRLPRGVQGSILRASRAFAVGRGVALWAAAGVLLCAPEAVATTSYNASFLGKAGKITRGLWGWAADGHEYALVCARTTLDVYDVTSPSAPIKIAAVPSLGTDMLDVRTKDHYAIAINQCGPIQVIDLSNPAAIQTVATYQSATIPGAHTIFVAGDYAYLSCWGAGQGDFRILDISDPLNPMETGFWQHPNQTPPGAVSVPPLGALRERIDGTVPAHTDSASSCQVLAPDLGDLAVALAETRPEHGGGGVLPVMAHDCYVRGDTAYVAYGGGGFAVIDLTDRANPATLALVEYEHAASHSMWLTEDGSFLLHCDEKPGGRLTVWDVRDLTQITEAGAFETEPDRMIHNVYVQGELAFLAYYTDGIRVLDVSNPPNPIEVAYYDLHGGPVGAYFEGAFAAYPYLPSGDVLVNDMKDGLYVFTVDRAARGGSVGGLITTTTDGSPLDSAMVRFVEYGKTIGADSSGSFRYGLPTGQHTMIVERYGFEPDTSEVWITEELTAQVLVDLVQKPTGPLHVVFRADWSGEPIERVAIAIPGLPGGVRYTDAEGVLDWGFVPVGTYQATIGRLGCATQTRAITVYPSSHYDGFAPVLTLHWNFADDASVDQGWLLGVEGDDAVEGGWVRQDPNPSWSVLPGAVSPDWDANGSPLGYAFHTGYQLPDQGQGLFDVDDGKTTLLSPRLDLTVAPHAFLEYYRWFSNDTGGFPGEDPFRVEVSDDDGETWFLLEEVWLSARAWVYRSFALYPLFDPTDRVRVRFTASDWGGDSIVEAAVDRVNVRFETVDVEGSSSTITALATPVPNPAPGGRAMLHFQLARPAAECRLTLVDARGRIVRELARGPRTAGPHAVSLAGGGVAPLAPGLYWVRLEADGESRAQKVVVVDG